VHLFGFHYKEYENARSAKHKIHRPRKSVMAQEMKADRKTEAQLHSFLTSTLDGHKWPTSSPGQLSPGEGSYSTHLILGRVCPKTVLGVLHNTNKKNNTHRNFCRSLVTVQTSSWLSLSRSVSFQYSE
jgi:hypothetical protein